MKSLCIISIFLLLALTTNAQAPEQFSFQGVARGADGKLVSNIIVRLRVTIHSESPTGPTVYQETHQAPTNNIGVFNIAIGKGTGSSGNFSEIPWKALEHFIQLEMDPTGGNDFVDLGSTQLLSVPYALQAKASSHWSHGLPVIQDLVLEPGIDPNTVTFDDPKLQKYLLPPVGEGNKLIWYPLKGAFRVGSSLNGKWEDALLGNFSFATGNETEASGSGSAAFGSLTEASADFAFATGFNTEASGTASASFGSNSKAIGDASAAFGQFTSTKTRASFVAGFYNNIADSPDPANEIDTDRIFQIGNGKEEGKRKNALTVLRNGFVGLGKDALEPKYILDIDGRPRIRHKDLTAGIWFDGASGAERGFVGMKSENEVGFYLDTWQLWVNNQGNAYLNGNVSLTSDARLKHNLSPLSGSLLKINELQGYHYNWIDKAKDQAIQTGLIAQEVEKLFPELVKTDANGFKSVNYIGLVPHLIESVKALSEKNDALSAQNQMFKEQAALLMSKLEAMEARLDAAETDKMEPKAK